MQPSYPPPKPPNPPPKPPQKPPQSPSPSENSYGPAASYTRTAPPLYFSTQHYPPPSSPRNFGNNRWNVYTRSSRPPSYPPPPPRQYIQPNPSLNPNPAARPPFLQPFPTTTTTTTNTARPPPPRPPPRPPSIPLPPSHPPPPKPQPFSRPQAQADDRHPKPSKPSPNHIPNPTTTPKSNPNATAKVKANAKSKDKARGKGRRRGKGKGKGKGKGSGLSRWGLEDERLGLKEEEGPIVGQGLEGKEEKAEAKRCEPEPVLIDLTDETESVQGQASSHESAHNAANERKTTRPESRVKETPARGKARAVTALTPVALNAEKVLIDGQNVAYYSGARTSNAPRFRWDYLQSVVHLCVNAGVTPVVVLKPFGKSYPPPKELSMYVEYVSPADHVKDHDDSALLNMAIAFGCRYISNDNFRNFRIRSADGSSRSHMIAKFLEQHQDDRQVYFIISDNRCIPTSANGAFLLKRNRNPRSTRAKGPPAEVEERKKRKRIPEEEVRRKRRATDARTYAGVVADGSETVRTNDWKGNRRKLALFDASGQGSSRVDWHSAATRMVEGKRSKGADAAEERRRKESKAQSDSAMQARKRIRKRGKGSKRKAEEVPQRNPKRARNEGTTSANPQAIRTETQRGSREETQVNAVKEGKRRKKTRGTKKKKKDAQAERDKELKRQARCGAVVDVCPWQSYEGLHPGGWNGHKNHFRCPTCKAGFMSFFLCVEHMVVHTNHFPMEKKITPMELYNRVLIQSVAAEVFNHNRSSEFMPMYDPEIGMGSYQYACPHAGCKVGTKRWEAFRKHWYGKKHGLGHKRLTIPQQKAICTRPGWQGCPYDFNRLSEKTIEVEVPELQAVVRENASADPAIWQELDCRIFAREEIFIQRRTKEIVAGRLIGITAGSGSFLCTNGCRISLRRNAVDGVFRKYKHAVRSGGSRAEPDEIKESVGSTSVTTATAAPAANPTDDDDAIEISDDSSEEDIEDITPDRAEPSQGKEQEAAVKAEQEEATQTEAKNEDSGAEEKNEDFVHQDKSTKPGDVVEKELDELVEKEVEEVVEQKGNKEEVVEQKEEQKEVEERSKDIAAGVGTSAEEKSDKIVEEEKDNEPESLDAMQHIPQTEASETNGRVELRGRTPSSDLLVDLDRKIAEMSNILL